MSKKKQSEDLEDDAFIYKTLFWVALIFSVMGATSFIILLTEPNFSDITEYKAVCYKSETYVTAKAYNNVDEYVEDLECVSTDEGWFCFGNKQELRYFVKEHVEFPHVAKTESERCVQEILVKEVEE